MTQQELADEAKVTRQYITMLEGGKNTPSIPTIERIAAALDVSVSALLDEEAA